MSTHSRFIAGITITGGLLAFTLAANVMGQEASTPKGVTTKTFLEFKMPRTNNEYDNRFLDECPIGQEWVLKTWQRPEAEWKTKLGYYEVVRDPDPKRGNVLKLHLGGTKGAVEGIGYNFHTQIPAEYEATTFYARLEPGSPSVTLYVGHDTRRVPGNWFTHWSEAVEITSAEWKKYVVMLDGVNMRRSFHGKAGAGYATEDYTRDFVNEIVFEHAATNGPAVLYLDDGGFEVIHGKRKGLESLRKDDSATVKVVQPIEDFENGIARLGKNTTNDEYMKGNWALAREKHSATLCTNDAAGGRQSARIAQGPHEGDVLFEVESGPAPQAAKALSFHLKALDYRWRQDRDAAIRYPFFVYAVIWTLPAAEQPRMQTATGNDLYAAEGFRWSFGNRALADKDGKPIPRAYYSARVKLDFDRLNEWQHVVIPFEAFTCLWSLEKDMKGPVNPQDIFHVGVYTGAKDMFSTAYLLDELAFSSFEAPRADITPAAGR